MLIEDEIYDLIYKNPYSSLIYKIYLSLNDVYAFYAAYISEHIDDETSFDSPFEEIEPNLMNLAACKIKVDEGFAPNFIKFRSKVMKDYEEWIKLVKDKAFRAGAPLRAELLDAVYGSHEKIGQDAEAESLGFISSRLHPDIYMNEILVGMRAIHQVLPAILKKLGISDEFKLDRSEFYIK